MQQVILTLVLKRILKKYIPLKTIIVHLMIILGGKLLRNGKRKLKNMDQKLKGLISIMERKNIIFGILIWNTDIHIKNFVAIGGKISLKR